jgi:hypothetical protein
MRSPCGHESLLYMPPIAFMDGANSQSWEKAHRGNLEKICQHLTESFSPHMRSSALHCSPSREILGSLAAFSRSSIARNNGSEAARRCGFWNMENGVTCGLPQPRITPRIWVQIESNEARTRCKIVMQEVRRAKHEQQDGVSGLIF